jgi:Tol biopolymer transport system component/tRNA A-37 threonylcarbamoyl transferase component Bud32
MVGRSVSHYEIVEKLGEGGMGVVYKARDARLGRFVALKVLPEDKVRDAERRQRFAQEARAASAINHPHIVTVHDVGESEGVHFIAMELVEGRTLAERMGRRPLPLREALALATQVADALAQAHAKGIVHRDLKPGNVIVTPAGVAKVLDFGLAKLVETEVSEDEPTEVKPATDAGMIVGTAAYMSPEQAQGRRVDARSDIFSFGAVLYEMVTGRRAFPADSKTAALAAILRDEPRPASEVSPAVPRELERLIQHCMKKDPSRRFQHMDDVRTLLDELREDSDSGKLGAAPPARPAGLARYRPIGLAVAGLVVAGIAGVWVARRAPRAAEAPLVAVPLTASRGIEMQPSFSPDGNEVVFAGNGEREENFDLYRMLIGSGEPLRLTRDAADDVSPAWSPDGRSIAFARLRHGEPAGVFVIPALGGTERQVGVAEMPLPDDLYHTGLAWSPDSRGLIVADVPEGEPPGLFLIPLDGGEKRRLTSAPGALGDWDPALDRDGRRLVFVRQFDGGNGDLYQLTLDAAGAPGEPRRLTRAKREVASPVWSADASEILFTRGNRMSERQLWSLAAAAAGTAIPPERTLPVGGDATAIAFSPMSKRLVFSRRQLDINIHRLALSETGEPVGPPEPFLASTRVERAPDYSPAGDAVTFASTRSGSQEIWVANADGSSPRQITTMGGPLTANPRWSPDGRTILFDSRREGSSDLYVVGAQGGTPRRLTDHPGAELEARWSRDGRFVYFASERTGRLEVWKVPAAGGEAVQVTRNGGRNAVESPDGAWLYYAKGYGWSGVKLWRAPLAGGKETLVLEELSYGYNFAPTSRGVYFTRGSRWPTELSLEFLDFASGRTRVLQRARQTADLGLALSPDGRELLYVQFDAFGADLMLVEGFR